MRWAVIVVGVMSAFGSGVARADPPTPADQEMGHRYVRCGQLMIAVSQAGGDSAESVETKNGLVMTALGGMLLGANSPEAIQPHLDIARASIQAKARGPNGQRDTFDDYADCVTLDNEQTPALVERFKDQMARTLKDAGRN